MLPHAQVAIEVEGKPVNSITSLSKLIMFQGLLMVNLLGASTQPVSPVPIPVSMTMTQPDASPAPVPVRVMLTMPSSSDEPHSVFLEPTPFNFTRANKIH